MLSRLFRPGQKIGLLGGSFNPAHEGHLHLSRQAQRRLKLDLVMWLVSPQNPLKSTREMADYKTRLHHARRVTASVPFISVSDYEREHHLYFSYETIAALQKSYPNTHFVWLMGADNLANFHRWREWRRIMQSIPIAIFDRSPFSHNALRQPAALSYEKKRIKIQTAARLPLASAPAWLYDFMPRHPQSATKIRKTLGEHAFL